MARVTGIGGIFLRSNDPERLAGWYAQHLGMAVGPHAYASLSWKDEVPPGSGTTTWCVFPQGSAYLGDAAQQTMVNYRVDDLDGLLEQLSAAGVWVDPKRENHSFGRFAWIQDCDGNRLELWQPLTEPAGS